MILEQFQTWVRGAPSSRRAEGVSALARAYLYSDLDQAQKAEAVRVLTGFLDDPSADVRRALAEALASAADAPHHLVLALADDCAAVSTPVLSRSPVLSEAELIDCAATAEPAAQGAIAGRSDLSPALAAALAEVASPPALAVLAANHAVAMPAFAIRRMVERHGANAELRDALLRRPDLPAGVRLDLVSATAEALCAFVTARNWVSNERIKRVAAEAGARAAVTIATGHRDSRREIVAHLRRSGGLTASFALRAILSGKIELFKAVLVELSGVAEHRVDDLTRRCGSTGFAALHRTCGLPSDLLPVFRVALEAARNADWTQASGAGLSRSAIERVLTASAAINGGELDTLMVLLRRFEAEAAREEARRAPLLPAPILGPLRLVCVPEEPLLLSELDAFAADHAEGHAPFDAEPRAGVLVDLEALEAELCAA